MLSQNRSLKMQSASPSPSASANTTTNTAHLAAQLELLSQHTTPISSDNATAPSRGARPQAAKPPTASPAHGYSNGTNSPPSDVLPPIVNNSSSNNNADPEAHIHPDLRAARNVHAPDVNMMPAGPPPPQQAAPPVTAAGPSTAPPPPTHPASTAMALDDGGAGSKAKRELSQSKRAAQNRAAQRAFRQRKEHYIKKLEQQVRDYMEMEQSYKAMQSENYALREYVIHLQSRLLDAQGEIPQPPPNVNLAQPPMPPASAATSAPEVAPSNPAAGTPLEAVAQAVAGLAAQEQLAGRQQFEKAFSPEQQGKDETRREGEEIDSQLQQDGLPAAPTASM
ncbi:putative transcription factor kapC [Colletotrichum sp. SAR 10_70]|nr:putative transcription factor kapC [Colletotrichum sp. SAR 10_71]KAI8170628.1 putative transcription factor kapC [Colletotrichum sp. SAR 10_70]KAI8180736.1 putative transcription factor kapC [Colletotrichum sp. SAR 10_75]KAI8205270.1 putative transcription factor kapC [Colletotrichum sp. SAR 10_76]KAI8227129.1 putative transcription factor kapC [Colletotrichum sp. SAR 10_96]KAI8252114.1 putative transcription factor kapC [Colletotrichum sp. SAR11_239]KAI8279720.1 putative transcription fac